MSQATLFFFPISFEKRQRLFKRGEHARVGTTEELAACLSFVFSTETKRHRQRQEPSRCSCRSYLRR